MHRGIGVSLPGFAAAVVGVLALAACSGGDNPASGGTGGCSGVSCGTGGTAGSGGVAGTGGSAGNPGDSDTFNRPPSCVATDAWIVEVRGKITNETGTGIDGARAGYCLRSDLGDPTEQANCLRPQATDAQGDYVITVPDQARCHQRGTMRVFQFPSMMASTYCILDVPLNTNIFQVDPLVLFETTAPPALPPAGTTTDMRTVEFADGLELDFTPEDFFGEYAELGAAAIDPTAAGLCFLDNPSSLTKVYAFHPEGGLVAGKSFPMRIPNSEGLPAGSQVNYFVLGGLGYELVDGTEVAEGEWVQFGTGTVDGAGVTISGDPLPFLNWFGYGPQ